MITKASIQAVVDAASISDVVGDYVHLKKRGSNYLGLCPFHHEKTPSFTVSPAKEIYKCFGCGKSGNSVGFIMDVEKYTFVEAIRYLANKFQITLEETEVTEAQKQAIQAGESLYILNNFAKDFFKNALQSANDDAQIAQSYLQERGFLKHILEKFDIGYCPTQPPTFSQTAQAQKFSDDVLLKSGLSVIRNNVLTDNYKGRIIFPIHQQNGKIIGFGTRQIQSQTNSPKYINTPENEVYNKSKVLYGIYQSKTAINKKNECILVEGYTDVISLHQAGIENAVASGGTSLTVEQLRIIKKLTPSLTILYDGDAAGIKAAIRAIELSLDEELHVNLVLIADGDDPDSYIKKHGAQAFEDYLQHNKKNYVAFLIANFLKNNQPSPTAKQQLINQLAQLTAKLNKPNQFSLRQDYIKQSAQLLAIDEQGLINLVNQNISALLQKNIQKNGATVTENTQVDFSAPSTLQIPETDASVQNPQLKNWVSDNAKFEAMLVKNLIEFGAKFWDEQHTVADYIFEICDSNDYLNEFEDDKLINLYNAYKTVYLQYPALTVKQFIQNIDDLKLMQTAINLANDSYELSANWVRYNDKGIPGRTELYAEEINSSLLFFRLRHIRKLIMENQQELEKAVELEDIQVGLQTQMILKDEEKQLASLVGLVVYK